MSRALVVLAMIAGTAAADPAPDEVLAGVDKVYGSMNAASFGYEQTLTIAGVSSTTKGSMDASRPWKLAWRLRVARTPATRVSFAYDYLFDGTWVTHFDRANRQVVRGPLCGNTTPAALSFLLDDRTLAETFTPRILSVASNAVELELTPIENMVGVSSVILTIDPATYEVRRAMAIDQTGDTNSIEMTAIRLTKKRAPRRAFESDLTRAAKYGLSVVQQTSCAASTSGTAAASTTATTDAGATD